MRLGFNAYARPAPVPKMPPGLVEIMEGLSREVLKHNPADTEVYRFCANHMKKLLDLRDAVEGKKVKQPLSLEEKIARCQEKVRQNAAQRRKREVPYLETEDEIDKAATSYAVEESIVERQAQGETCEDISEITKRVMPLLQEMQAQGGEITEQTCEDISDITKPVTPLLQETQAQGGEITDQICEDIADITKPVTPLLQETQAQGEIIDQTCEDISEITKLISPLLQENNANLDKEVERLDNIEVPSKDGKEPVIDELQILTDTKEEIADVENVLDVKVTSKEINILTEPLTLDDPGAKSNDAVLEAEDTGTKLEEIIIEGDNATKTDTTIDKIDVSDKNVAIESEQDEERRDSEKNSVLVSGPFPFIDVISAQDKDSYEKKETPNNENNSEINTESLSEDFTEIKDNNIQKDIIEAKNTLLSEHVPPVNPEVVSMEEDAITNFKELKSDEPELTSDVVNMGTNIAETRPEVIEIMTQKTIKNLSAIDTIDALKAATSPENVINNMETETEKNIEKQQDTSEKQESPIERREFEAMNEQDEKPENKDFEETGDSITPVSNDEINKEIEMIQLNKTPEIIDEDSLKENEVSIVAKSNDQETLVFTNSSDRIDEINSLSTSQVKKDSETATKTMDMDITTIAKSDNNEETTNGSSCDTTRSEDPDETPTKNSQTSGMDLETAAVTIQKVFRNFLFKSRQSTLDDVSNDEGSIDVAEDNLSHEAINMLKTEDELHTSNIRERRSLGISRMESVLQTVNEEKSLSLSTDDSSLSSAATIIQAHVRGFLVRNKLHNKTSSTNSQSLEVDNEPNKNKTVLNIIVPEGGHFMSRDESMAMSLDLPYDGSPPTSSLYKLSLHPLSYDVSERRKLLKREDAIQSVSPPSTNSGKLSEDVDSVKDMTIHDNGNPTNQQNAGNGEANEIESQVSKDETQDKKENDTASGDTTPTISVTGETVVEVLRDAEEVPKTPKPLERKSILTKQSSDEMDVVTPFVVSDEQTISPVNSENTTKLLHSSEFHDAVLPTNVSRTDTSVAREFKNVVVYFLLWNNSS